MWKAVKHACQPTHALNQLPLIFKQCTITQPLFGESYARGCLTTQWRTASEGRVSNADGN